MHASANVYLSRTCTHAGSAFRVLASADKSRWRLCVGDGEREAERGKKRERQRERERDERECERGSRRKGGWCIVEAHALELDEHLPLHIRVPIFFPLASGHLVPLLSYLPPSIPLAVSPFPPFPLAFYYKRALG